MDLQWDPNSSNYLLVCWEFGDMSMIDCKTYQEMIVFDQ